MNSWTAATSCGVGRPAGADRPDRLIGDDGVGRGAGRRKRALELAPHDVERLAVPPLVPGLANADDRFQSGPMGRPGLGGDDGVALAVVGATFRMADDHRLGAGICQHLGGDVSGMGAVIVRVAILGAEQNGASGQHHGGLKEQRRRRTDQDIGVGPRAFRQTIEQRPDLGEIRAQAMHLPIAGDERPDCTHCDAPIPILNPPPSSHWCLRQTLV